VRLKLSCIHKVAGKFCFPKNKKLEILKICEDYINKNTSVEFILEQFERIEKLIKFLVVDPFVIKQFKNNKIPFKQKENYNKDEDLNRSRRIFIPNLSIIEIEPNNKIID